MKSDLLRSATPRHTFLSFPFFTSLLSCHSFHFFPLTPFISLIPVQFFCSPSLSFFPFHLYHPHALDSFTPFSSFITSFRLLFSFHLMLPPFLSCHIFVFHLPTVFFALLLLSSLLYSSHFFSSFSIHYIFSV